MEGPGLVRRRPGGTCLAAASYLRRAGSDVYLPFKLDVLRIGGGLIAEITTFDAPLFDRFGLPATLPATVRR